MSLMGNLDAIGVLINTNTNKPSITNSNIGAGRRSDILKHSSQRWRHTKN